MNIREAIIHATIVKKWDYSTLAKRAGVDRTSVYRYFNGERDLNGEKLGCLLEALNLDLAMPEWAIDAKDAIRQYQALLSIEDVAERVDVPVTHITRAIKSGQIDPPVKPCVGFVYRFYTEDDYVRIKGFFGKKRDD